MKTGVLYGVGLGPGDPELLTIKALRVIRAADVVAVPSSIGETGPSLALEIIKKAGVEPKEVLQMHFPMSRDKELVERARNDGARLVAQNLLSGKDVAFVTLGDSQLYSTFSLLAAYVRCLMPDVAIESVPGVASFSAASARANVPLATSGERVAILPGPGDFTELKRALEEFETVVIMKLNKSKEEVIGTISSIAPDSKVLYAERVGWPDEFVTEDLSSALEREPQYFSMLIVRKGGGATDGKK